MTALTDLLAALESGDRMATFDAMCAAIAADHLALAISSYDNTQAAIDLIGAVLPGRHWSASESRSGCGATVWHEPDKVVAVHTATGPTPARALLIAAVKALVAKETQ